MYKVVKADEVFDYCCECGNTSDLDGFFPCDSKGNEIEPTIESGWDGHLYVCIDCGKIMYVN